MYKSRHDEPEDASGNLVISTHQPINPTKSHLDYLDTSPRLFPKRTKMKPSLTFVPVRLGLAAAAPQSNPDPSRYGPSKDFPDRIKKTLEDLKAQKQNRRRRPKGRMASHRQSARRCRQRGHHALLPHLLERSQQPPTEEQAKDVLKKFASAAIAFVPTFGALGGLPDFLGIMKAITMGIFNFESPELAAKADMKGNRFSDEATYEHLCNNCQPHLTISWLGRLNGCTKDKVVKRDARQDHVRAPSFAPATAAARRTRL